MLRVAINDYIALRGTSGTARATTEIVQALRAKNMEVLRLHPRRLADRSLSRAAQMWWWDQVGFDRAVRQVGADVAINPTNSGRASCPSALVVQDTMVLDHPALFDRRFVAYARATIPPAVRSADVIVTGSEHSARRIRSRWDPKAPIHVVPWPVAVELTAVDATGGGEPTGRELVLVVASSDRHKRLPLAVEVVASARQRRPHLQLILVARPGNGQDELEQALRRWDPHGQWATQLKSVSDAELSTLYLAAESLLVPSLDEGYCLPALEALALGTPVVHAGFGALPELLPQPARAYSDEVTWLASQVVPMGQRRTRESVLEAAQPALRRGNGKVFANAWAGLVRGLVE